MTTAGVTRGMIYLVSADEIKAGNTKSESRALKNARVLTSSGVIKGILDVVSAVCLVLCA